LERVKRKKENANMKTETRRRKDNKSYSVAKDILADLPGDSNEEQLNEEPPLKKSRYNEGN
jgi:hypothetical protein